MRRVKRAARSRVIVGLLACSAALLAGGCGIAGGNGEAADTSTPPLATVPPPTTVPDTGGTSGAVASTDPCDWLDDDVLDELFDGRPPEAESSSAITHRQCDWKGSLGSTALSVRVDSPSVYDELARNPSVPSLAGTALESLVEELPGDSGRRASVRLTDATLQVTLERFGVMDEDLAALVDEILFASGN